MKRPPEYCGCIDIADGATVLKYSELLLPTERQAASKIVLLNKAELADGETLTAVEARVRQGLSRGKNAARLVCGSAPEQLLRLPVRETPELFSCNEEWNRRAAIRLARRDT